MLIATLAFTVMQALIKQIGLVSVIQIVFFRSVISAFISTSKLRKEGISIQGKNKKLLIFRAIFGLISMSLFFITIQRMPFGASVTIKYLSPMFAVVLAAIYLREKVKALQWLFIALSVVGIILLKGFDTRIDNLNLILGVVGAFFGGLVYVVIRRIGKTEHPLVIVNYFMSISALASGILLLKYWETPSLAELLILVLIGWVGYFGQRFMTIAFQLEETNIVAPFKYLELVYAFLVGYIIFGESYKTLAFLGVLIIIISFTSNYFVAQRYRSKKLA